MALPTFYDLDAPASNLAAAFDVPQAIPNHVPQLYVAADGTPLDYGGSCTPITKENVLSDFELGLYDVTDYIPEVLQEKRVTWMESLSMPLTLAAVAYSGGALATPKAAAVVTASYFAPYPVALLAAYMAWKESRSGSKYRRRPAGRRRGARKNRYVRY